MKQIFTLFWMTLASLGVAQSVNDYIKTDLIIKLTPTAYDQMNFDHENATFGIASLDALGTELQIANIRPIGQHRITHTFVLGFNSQIEMDAAIARYKALGLIEYACPNRIGKAGGHESEITPNDPRFAVKQWSLYNPGTQTGIGPVVADADVDMDQAWDIQTGDPNMIIAVIDGGARLTHPDFAARIWHNLAETANGIDDDGNGLIDDTTGWDFFFNDNDPTDERGHGTNVSGIIGAISNNGILFTGANWNSKIMLLKAIDYDLNATYESVSNSIYYAVDHGAKIINFSIGMIPAQVVEDFTAYADTHNVFISACMMNYNNDTVYYPAGYSGTHHNVIACGSTSANDYRTSPFDWDPASGSNYGSHICVTAPGSYIYNLAFNNDIAGGVYWSGTSMATPLVASIASLVWAENPALTPSEVRQIIEDTAQDQVGNPAEDTPGFDNYMGHGRANAYAAVLAAQALARAQFTGQPQEFEAINPVKSAVLNINSKGQYAGAYELTVSAMDGKILARNQVKIQAGANRIDFDCPQGSYIVTLKSDRYTKILKILKQ